MLSACATWSAEQNKAVTTAGQGVAVLAAKAANLWINSSAGNRDAAWAISSGLLAYQDIVRTAQDVRAVVKAFSGDAKAAAPLANELAQISAQSTAPPDVTAAVIATGVEKSAATP